MIGSILASIGAGTAGLVRRHSHREADLQDLANLMRELASGQPFDPDEAERRLRRIVDRGMINRARHPDDLDDIATLQLALSEIRLQIADRRKALHDAPNGTA